jgi:hypothetical protein
MQRNVGLGAISGEPVFKKSRDGKSLFYLLSGFIAAQRERLKVPLLLLFYAALQFSLVSRFFFSFCPSSVCYCFTIFQNPRLLTTRVIIALGIPTWLCSAVHSTEQKTLVLSYSILFLKHLFVVWESSILFYYLQYIIIFFWGGGWVFFGGCVKTRSNSRRALFLSCIEEKIAIFNYWYLIVVS